MRAPLLLALLSAAGCSAAPAATTPKSFTLPEALHCGRAVPDACGPRMRSFPDLPSTLCESCSDGPGGPDDPPVTAGQMSDAAATAKRLFDNHRWSHAAPRILAVARGDTKDDMGNRQIADYHLAIALYYLGDRNASADLWTGISWNPRHQKFRETMLWLGRLAVSGECVPRPVLEALTRYHEEPITCSGGSSAAMTFRNPTVPGQRERWKGVLFARARGLMLAGNQREARSELESLLREPHLAAAARQCLSAIDHPGGA